MIVFVCVLVGRNIVLMGFDWFLIDIGLFYFLVVLGFVVWFVVRGVC